MDIRFFLIYLFVKLQQKLRMIKNYVFTDVSSQLCLLSSFQGTVFPINGLDTFFPFILFIGFSGGMILETLCLNESKI